jgi:AcrR family transcriptional regulator
MNTDSSFDVNPRAGGARPAPSQDRSRLTAERFLSAALKLLETSTFEALSVADIAREAGRSVGAFYQRYGSKDDFLTVLVNDYFERGEVESDRLLAQGEDESVLDTLLAENFAVLLRYRNLWHAALRRSAHDPTFWAQFHSIGRRRLQILAARLGELRGRPLSEDELLRLAIALQVFNSVINNQMINTPGPLSLSSPDFLPSLLRVFHAVYAAAPGAPQD